MTKYSKTALQAIINDNFADNNAGDITAALLRSTTIDITDSLGFYLGVEGQKLYIPFESGINIFPGSFMSASLVDTGNGSGYITLSCILNAGNGISIASNGEVTPDLLSTGGLAINSNKIAMDINNLSTDSNAGNLSDSIAISDASSSNDTKKITISQLSDVLGVFNVASGNRIETNTTNIATNTANIATNASGTMSQLRVTNNGKDENLFDGSGVEFIGGSNVTISMADSTSGVALTFSVPSNLFTNASGDLIDANVVNISANTANISSNTSALATKGSGTMSQFRVTNSGKDENLFDGSGIEFIAGSNMTVSMTDSASGVGITFGTTGLQETIDSSNRLNANLIGANGDVSNTEFGYLSNVSSDIQSQLDAKPFNLASGNLIRSIEADVATKGTMSQLRVTNSGKDEYLSNASGIQFIAGSNMTISMADNTSGVALTFTSSAEGGGSFSLASGNLIDANTASIAANTASITGKQDANAALDAISSTGAIESNDGQLMVFHNVSSGVYIGDHTHSNLITHTAEGVVAASGRNVHVGFGAGSGSKTGYQNTLIGALAGVNLSEFQYGNTFIGNAAGSGLTSGDAGGFGGGGPLYNNIIIGNRAGVAPNFSSSFYQNVIIGNDSIYDGGNTVYNCVAVGENVLKAAVLAIDTVAIGFDAARNAGNPHSSVIIGDSAGYTDTTPINCVYIGKEAAYSTSAGDNNVIIGYRAGYYGNRDNTTAVGQQAGQGKSGDSAGTNSVYLGYKAGSPDDQVLSNNELYIANNGVSSSGTLIKGDFKNKFVAVGNADKDLSPGSGTLQIFPRKPSNVGLYVEALPDQTAPLAEFRDESGDVAASVGPEGVITASGISLGGSGIRISGTTYSSFGDVVTLDVGKGENDIAQFTASVADDDFLRIDGNKVEGLSASEVAAAITPTTVVVSNSSANTAFPVVFHDESNALLDDTGSFTYNPSNQNLLLKSSSTTNPLFTIENSTNDATAGEVRFQNTRAVPTENDVLGTLSFYAQPSGEPNDVVEYGRIQCKVSDFTGTEDSVDRGIGTMTFATTAPASGTAPVVGLKLVGDQTTAGQVNVYVGAGASSITRIEGYLSLGDRNITDVGDIAVDSVSADSTGSSGKVTIKTNSADQAIFTDGAFYPATTDDLDLGKSDKYFKNAYVNNLYVADSLASNLQTHILAIPAIAAASGTMSVLKVTNSGKDENLSDGSGIQFIAGSNMTVSMADNTSGVAMTFGTTGLQSEIDASNRLNANLIHDGSIDNTEFGYLNGVSSNIQTQLDAKQATLTFGISNNNVLQADANVADDDFLRVAGTQIEGRSASELLSDIGAASTSTPTITGDAIFNEGISVGKAIIPTGIQNAEVEPEDAVVNIDLRKSNYYEVTLGAAATGIHFTYGQVGQRFVVRFEQPGGANYAITWNNTGAQTHQHSAGSPTGVTTNWPGGTAPTMTATNGSADTYGFIIRAPAEFDGYIIGQDIR